MENPNDIIVNRFRDLPACKASVVARFEGFIFGHVNVISVISASKGYESNIYANSVKVERNSCRVLVQLICLQAFFVFSVDLK